MFEFLSDVKKDLKAGLRSLTLRNKTNTEILSKESEGGKKKLVFSFHFLGAGHSQCFTLR